MKKDVVFISVQPIMYPARSDVLLVAIDTFGRVWTKFLWADLAWTAEPVPMETVN